MGFQMEVKQSDFEESYTFHDVCTYCKKPSDDYQMIVVDGKNYYRCPNCGEITK